MKATVNQMDSQGHIPPDAYFKNFNIDTKNIQQHNYHYLQSMDHRLDQSLKLKRDFNSHTYEALE
jgi:hypothetical protein